MATWFYGNAIGPEVYRLYDTLAENLFEACSRTSESYRHMNLVEQHFKNTLPLDGQSWSFQGLWALGDLCMNNHYTIRWNSLIYLMNNGHDARSPVVQDSVCSSVEAVAFVCRLWFSPSLQNWTFDTDDPQSYLKLDAAYRQSGRKCKAISNEKSLVSTFQCWSKILPSNQC